MGALDGKVAVIAGGTSGIGARTAELFVEEGAQIVITGRRRHVGEALAERLGSTTRFIQTDVAQEADVAAMIDCAVQAYGRLDCLFNNAGFGAAGTGIADLDMTQYDQLMNVLMRGVVLGMKYAAKVMQPQGSGSIINTASVAGLRTGYSSQTYSAAKAAVIHMTRCVAMELGERSIRVNSISPGGIVTGIFGKAFGMQDDVADRQTEAVASWAAALQLWPIPRVGVPDDVARAALYLASDASSFITGHDLVVDGGLVGGLTFSASNAMYGKLGDAFNTAAKG
jgi:NAD(P)-dependent dehydrogenase (short-subunit alcohol dehydrogenase family)